MPSDEGKDYADDNTSTDGIGSVVDKVAAITLISEGDEGFLSVSDVVVRLEASCRVAVALSDGEDNEQDYVLVAKD